MLAGHASSSFLCCLLACHTIDAPRCQWGAVIVLMEGENIQLTPGERKLLAKGPKYCILKSCSDEAICKHKWDCLACGESNAPLLELTEEQKETERLQELAEERREDQDIQHE